MKVEFLKLKENNSISVTEDTQFVLDIPFKSGKYVVELKFEKEGVAAEIIGLYKLGMGDNLHLTTIANHLAPHTTCVTNVKGVLTNGSKSDYIGKILINKKAQQTSSYLDDSVLILGENTHNNSQPILEIEADDVKASHGATTGRIDENQIYYLTSRGLTRVEAQDLIVDGFFESVLATIKSDEIRQKLKDTLSLND
ncbi:MAG: SufD family Fe-S cluster assembly protein [Patescibacteria group bacterium]